MNPPICLGIFIPMEASYIWIWHGTVSWVLWSTGPRVYLYLQCIVVRGGSELMVTTKHEKVWLIGIPYWVVYLGTDFADCFKIVIDYFCF